MTPTKSNQEKWIKAKAISNELEFEKNILQKIIRPTPSNTCVVFFSGFPGAPPENPKLSILELLQAISDKQNCDAFAVSYKGLELASNQGEYSFLYSISNAKKIVKWLQSKGYTRFHFIGYSWGGLVTINTITNLNPTTVGTVILLAPLIIVPPANISKQMLIESKGENPHLSSLNIEKAVEEVKHIKMTHQPTLLFNKLAAFKNLTIIHGNADEVVPLDTSLLLKNKVSKVKLITLDNIGHDVFEDQNIKSIIVNEITPSH